MRASLLLLMFLSGAASADGLPLTSGRCTDAKVSVFTLTPKQKNQIAFYRRCYTNNTKTPYVFRLTAQQSAGLKREADLSPDRFEIYETYRGFNDAGPHWNLVLRFSEDQIEVPHDLLLSNEEAKKAEDVQGWANQSALPERPASVQCGAVQPSVQPEPRFARPAAEPRR